MSLDSGSVGSITFTLTAQDLASRVFLEVQNAMANLQRAAQVQPVALDQTAQAEEEVAASSAKTSREVTTLGSSLGDSARRAGEFALAFLEFKGIEDVLGGIKSAFIDFNAQLQQAQITWSVFLGSQSDATQMLDHLQQFASITPFHFQDLEQGARTLLAMGVTASQIMPEMRDIATAASASPNGAAGLERITYALAEMQGQGRVDARIMRELTMDGVPAWRMLAEAMNLPLEQVRKLSEAGSITSDTFMAAFHEWVTNHEGDLLAQQAQTFTGALTTLSDNLTIIGAQASKPLFDRIAASLANAASASIQLAQGPFGQELAGDATSILNALDKVDPKIVEAGAAFAAAAIGVELIVPAAISAATALAALEIALGPVGIASIAIGAFAAAYATNFMGVRDTTDKTTSTIVKDLGLWETAFASVGAALSKIQINIPPAILSLVGIGPKVDSPWIAEIGKIGQALSQLHVPPDVARLMGIQDKPVPPPAGATQAASAWNAITGNARNLLEVLPLIGPEVKLLGDVTDQLAVSERTAAARTGELSAAATEHASAADVAAGADANWSAALAKVGDAFKALGGDTSLASSLVAMDPAAQAAAASVSDLQAKVDGLRSAQEANSAATSNAQRALQGLQEQGQKLSQALSEAKQKLTDLTKTPLVGETAADNQIFSLQQRLERLQAQRDQVAMSEGPTRGGRSRPNPILTGIDQEIQREQARLDLLQKQKDLTFAPQHRAIDLAANGTPKELTAGQEIAQIKDTKAQITDLTAQQKTNADQTAAQKQTVDDLEGSQRALSTAMSAAQSQLAAAQSTQSEVNKGLQAQYDWVVKTRPEIEKLGPAYSNMVDEIDAKERVLAAATANFVQHEDANTKQALQNALDDLEKSRAQDLALLNAGQIPGNPIPSAAATHSPAGRTARINGFAGGGAFTVGGTGGTDSQLVQFMATPGERVSISPYSGSGGSGAMQVIVNIPQIVVNGANDAAGIAGQLAGEIARAIDSVVPTQVRSPNVSRRLLPGAM